MKRIPVLIIFLVLAFQNAAGQTFVHPGILHTQEDLSRIKSLVDNRTQPAYGSWEKLSSDPKSSPDYRIQGPFPIISPSFRAPTNTDTPRLLAKTTSTRPTTTR